jgi:hypothetical protein
MRSVGILSDGDQRGRRIIQDAGGCGGARVAVQHDPQRLAGRLGVTHREPGVVGLLGARAQVVDVRYQAGRFGSGFKPRPKSDAGIREIPLSPVVVEAIRDQLPPAPTLMRWCSLGRAAATTWRPTPGLCCHATGFDACTRPQSSALTSATWTCAAQRRPRSPESVGAQSTLATTASGSLTIC